MSDLEINPNAVEETRRLAGPLHHPNASTPCRYVRPCRKSNLFDKERAREKQSVRVSYNDDKLRLERSTGKFYTPKRGTKGGKGNRVYYSKTLLLKLGMIKKTIVKGKTRYEIVS